MGQQSQFRQIAVGTDLVAVERFADFDFSGRLATNLFTEKELADCQKKNNVAASLAGRFATKEAVRKCLEENIPYNHIEIVTTKTGKPIVVIHHTQVSNKYRLEVSFTHTDTFAQAICFARIIL